MGASSQWRVTSDVKGGGGRGGRVQAKGYRTRRGNSRPRPSKRRSNPQMRGGVFLMRSVAKAKAKAKQRRTMQKGNVLLY